MSSTSKGGGPISIREFQRSHTSTSFQPIQIIRPPVHHPHPFVPIVAACSTPLLDNKGTGYATSTNTIFKLPQAGIKTVLHNSLAARTANIRRLA